MPLAPYLTLGSRWTFVGGKGGVGKTTVAAALALELASRDESVTILSTDPAHSLGDAFGSPLTFEPQALPQAPRVSALEIDAAHEREIFLREHGESISTLVERGTYLDASDVQQVADLPVPGMDELGAILRLSRLAAGNGNRVILDTAPTGHTLRLLDLPGVALGWVEALEAMEAKHDAVAAAFGGAPADDSAISFLRDLRSELEELEASFRDAGETRFILVTTGEPGVLAETLRYQEELDRRGVALGGIVVNRVEGSPPAASLGAGMVYVPRLHGATVGVDGLRAFAAAASPAPNGAIEPDSDAEAEVEADLDDAAASGDLRLGDSFLPPLDRRIYFVGGKGGVGKTTVAAAVAKRLAATRKGPVLLLSVDPAGSLSEVLASAVGAEVTRPPGFEPLLAQQLDAERAWNTFRNQYEEEVEELFASLSSAGVTATLDRAVIDRLIDLAPPGIDELMALMEVVDAIEDGEYDALVLDTAPTGHFLRLLEMPELALEWVHSLLRLLLKYRDVVRLKGLGERVLQLSRTLKRLREVLSDETSTWVAVVALPESLSLPETARLVPRLRTLGLTPGAVIVNRAIARAGRIADEARLATSRLLAIDPSLATIAAPRMATGPAGAAAIEEFIGGWRLVEWQAADQEKRSAIEDDGK